MISSNIFERLPIYKLQELIGASHLEEVQNVLEAMNFDSSSSSLIHTRGFLSAYARATQNIIYLFTPEGLSNILGTLSEDEINEFCKENDILVADKEDFIGYAQRSIRNKEFRDCLARAMGLEEFLSEEGGGTQKFDYFDFIPSAKPYKPLKDYQFEVYFQAVEKLKNISSRFILQMPTGSGKTRTAMEIACDYLNSHPDGTVIWLAHSTELCDQASECFGEVWPHLAKRNLRFQRYYGKHKLEPIADYKVGFLCSSFQSLLSRIEASPESIDTYLCKDRLIVVDEAHKVVAPTYKKVTQSLLNDWSSVMGLTATPGRSYGALNTDDENEMLADFFFNTHLSFNPHGKDAIEYLRDKGVLAKATFEPLVISGVDLKLTAKELSYVSRMFELPAEVLVKIGKNHLRNAEIIGKLVDIVKSGRAKSIIFFATSLEQSKLVSSLLNFLGVSAQHVDGATPAILRKDAIDKFRRQEIYVLCNYEVLSTGFDAPLVDCVFIARPTASVVLYSQMIGRGLRGPAIGGKDKCLIINVRDNIINLPGIDAMYRIFDEYWVQN